MRTTSDAAGRLATPGAPRRWARLARYARYAGYATCAWALAFAALSFYWAAGGTLGAETIGPALASLALARDPEFVAILWITGILKVAAALIALTLARPGWPPIPRRLLLAAGWGASAGLTLYGGASFVQHALMVTGTVAIPVGLGATAARWHLLLWDPWWLLGGLLFAVAVWGYGRRPASEGGRLRTRSTRNIAEDAEKTDS